MKKFQGMLEQFKAKVNLDHMSFNDPESISGKPFCKVSET